MDRARNGTNDAHITSPWDATALCARCAEPEGDPTEAIPAALLRRLLAETAQERSVDGAAPRFEVVELDPEEVSLDDSAFENASRRPPLQEDARSVTRVTPTSGVASAS